MDEILNKECLLHVSLMSTNRGACRAKMPPPHLSQACYDTIVAARPASARIDEAKARPVHGREIRNVGSNNSDAGPC